MSAAVLVMSAIVMVGCGDDDDWAETKSDLVGIWDSNELPTNESYDVAKYTIEILATNDKHSGNPYQLVATRKDGQQYQAEAGWMGWPNGAASNVVMFHDNLHSSERRVEIKWLNKSHTEFEVYDTLVFKKRK